MSFAFFLCYFFLSGTVAQSRPPTLFPVFSRAVLSLVHSPVRKILFSIFNGNKEIENREEVSPKTIPMFSASRARPFFLAPVNENPRQR